MTKIQTDNFSSMRNAAHGTWKVRSNSESSALGVSIASEGKGTSLEVLVPYTTDRGNFIPAKVSLNGRQARTLYEALRRFYETGSESA
jgi:hypothetical protein